MTPQQRYLAKRKAAMAKDTSTPAERFALLSMRRGVGDLFQLIGSHGVTVDELFASRSFEHVSHCRQEVWTVLRNSGMSYHAIGDLFNRDHSTVMNGIASHRARNIP